MDYAQAWRVGPVRTDPVTHMRFIEAEEEKQEFGAAFVVLVNPFAGKELTVRRMDWEAWVTV